MSKQQSLEKIKKIVDRYKSLSEADKNRYNEQQTKDHFIRPLFEALGWDFEHDVWPETDVSGKRVDYALKIGDVTKFFIEAKAISINLDEERWAEQAINYSWHKSVPWVILTDFEAIKIYNTEWDEPNVQSCQFFEIPYTEYLTSDKLWWLSKEAFTKGILDKQADQVGRRPKTIIDKQLANDLIRWRDLLYKNLCGYNPRIDKSSIAVYVQKILDRLIFIRTLEDRKIEDVTLQPLARAWQEKKGIKANELLSALNKVFRRIDSGYDSGLFEKGACDQLGEKIDADDNDFVEIIEDLYKTKKGVRYNFADIPADIFGSIYEQYLGHIQEEDEQENKKSKRKSQGIYYTPRWIVDYIVKNTLGEVFKNKTEEQIKKIKILDPACGSGSFLITAYQTLIDYWQSREKDIFIGQGDKLAQLEQAFKKRNNNLISPEQKQRILLNNIYGVDLDDEAIELARLNLLLKMVGRRIKLPSLSHNIEIGNSLIGDPKITNKAFNWQKRFPDVFKQGGFDIIIGNPPWGANIDKEAEYFGKKYPNSTKSHKDIYKIFIDKSLELLRDHGYLGFIVPNTFLYQPRYQDIKDIVDQYEYHAVNLGEKIFIGVQLPSCILILKKKKHDKKIIVDLTHEKRELLENAVMSIDLKNEGHEKRKRDNITKNTGLTFDDVFLMKDAGINYQAVKIGKGEKGKSKLGDLLFYEGKRENDNDVEYYKGQHINRYYIQSATKHFVRTNFESFKEKNERVILNKKFFSLTPKIIWRQTASKIIAATDEKGLWFGRSIIGAVIKKDYENKIDIYYALAIFNSKYIDYLYHQKVMEIGKVFPQVKLKYLRDLPFAIALKQDQHQISDKVKNIIIKLNQDLPKLDPDLDDKEYNQLKDEIRKVEKEIDKKIYALYGLTEAEKKIIEKD